ncbi:MAG: sigma-54-dependent Fis family transcriptional regulator [Chitinispirillaceae bacterium]|nr:sigma-54-dependent Fis family transcriptional regulator [Chitinispirillaceae bacterium]
MAVFRLSSEERALCALIREAGIANHFGEERLRLDKKIGGVTGAVSRGHAFSQAMTSVAGLTARMEKEGRADLNLYRGPDRDLVFFTFLFEIFHTFMGAFDRHILDQIASGDAAAPVGFAPGAFALFKKRGFTHDDGVLFFTIFFQLRRAYYLIEQQLVGISPCMQELRTSLWNNVFTRDILFYKQHLISRMEDFSTLILGDTGTGKGTAASAIGRSGFIPFDEKTGRFSESFTKSFVSINLSQFPEGIIESELFGHKKGAFTGAVEAHEGIFDTCSPHGSIFLDEIGDISVPVQIKLLQVIQERHFSPVGSHEKRRFSGRVIAATNKDVSALREKGLFRDDFYYRLCSDIIRMPTLSERIRENAGELESLIGHCTRSIAGTSGEELVATIRDIIDADPGKNYPWPGNVRELEQCIRRILIRREYRGDRRSSSVDAVGALIGEMRNESLSADNLLSRYCGLLYRKYGSYETVSRIVKLDRRTVKRYIEGSRINTQ